MKNVCVITSPELGWDCVIAVYDYDEVSIDDLRKAYPPDSYVIHINSLNTIENLQDDIKDRQECDTQENS